DALELLGNQPGVEDRRLERLYRLQQLAAFNARMSDYPLALALDPSEARRNEVAQRAIDALRELDTPEQPIRVAVRLRLGKLHLLKNEFDTARKHFDAIALDDSLQPAPTLLEQYQARFFRIVTDLAAGDLSTAESNLSELDNWQVIHLAADAEALASAEAATTMLRFRLQEARAQAAPTPEQRRKANEAAVATLSGLMRRRPDLAPTINELLLTRLPEDADLSRLDSLLLAALVRQGEEQRLRPPEEAVDPKILRRSIDAALELISRAGTGAVDAALVDNCRFVIPFLHQRLGDLVSAAGAFLDYAESAGPVERGQIALDNAQAAVAALRRERPEEEPVRALYERFLAVAIDRFERREFAFEQARRLQLLGRTQEAIRYFRMVPPDDSRLLTARFLLMLALKQHLDELPPADPSRAPLLGEIQQLADAVAAASSGPQAPPAAASMRVRTRLLAAELARSEQKQPQRAIDLLADIETDLANLPEGQSLLPEALLIRVQSYMALGRSSDATAALVQLLSRREGGQGAAIVYSLLQKLNDELDSARTAGDIDRMRTIARNRAELSGFLVRWARESPDPNINRYTYRYQVFDAASKHLAADLETDPELQRRAWQDALARYRALESPEALEQYRRTLDPRAGGTADYDPAVSFGIALLCHDLGEHREARDRLARLLHDRRLGPAVITTEEDGLRRESDNDQYWEGVLRFLRANLALGENLEQSRSYLRQQYIRWGDRVGGKRWKSEFEQLRRELIPDFSTSQPG
ncbi:MAG: hypothetical protein NZ561_04640, partial [Phycisphaerae bacterium]|nr:hypothetical protein [Phycisphaerae bacterium]